MEPHGRGWEAVGCGIRDDSQKCEREGAEVEHSGKERVTRKTTGQKRWLHRERVSVRWCRRQHGEKNPEGRKLKCILVWSGQVAEERRKKYKSNWVDTTETHHFA